MVLTMTDVKIVFLQHQLFLSGVWLPPVSTCLYSCRLAAVRPFFHSTTQSLLFISISRLSIFTNEEYFPSLHRSLTTHRAQNTAFSFSQHQALFVQLNSLFLICIELQNTHPLFLFFLRVLVCICEFYTRNINCTSCTTWARPKIQTGSTLNWWLAQSGGSCWCFVSSEINFCDDSW